MSLRAKIILLFIGLAIVPMLTLAGFSYWQAKSLVVGSVQDQLVETATAVSRELGMRGAEIEEAVRALASSPIFHRVLEGEAPPETLLPLLEPTLEEAAFIRVAGVAMLPRTLVGSYPEDAVLLTSLDSSGLVEFRRTLSILGGPGTLRVGFWASDLVPRGGRSPSVSLVFLETSEGRALFAEGPRALRAGDPIEVLSGLKTATFAAGPPEGILSFKDAGEAKVGAYAAVAGRPWAVVTAFSTSAALASLNRLVAFYWFFVLGLAVFTALAFSVLLGRFTRSLRDLARAAEHIGTGELESWLPLTTSGEVGQLTLAFNRMLERIREMMSQVDQSGRLAVVGQLSAYFAHEIRNPLTSIKLNLQRLKRWTHQGRVPDFCLEPLEISLREVERLSASVSDVLQLSKAQDAPQTVLSLHDQVEEAVHLLIGRFMGQGVELRLDLDADADLVPGRSGQVKSVILNLMVNALEAQPRGGFLEIRSELTRSPGVQGPAVALRFRDGGSGVPPAVRDRIFEPFFTTKAGGSGIGLAVAARAVRDNGGRLFLEEAPTAGAEFVMVLPLAAVDSIGVAVGEDTTREWGESPARDPEKTLPFPSDPGGTRGTGSATSKPEGGKKVVSLSLFGPEDVN